MMEWQPIETAPRDGTPIQVKIPGHGSDNVVAWFDDLMDSDGQSCGGWHWMEDNEPPDCWTDGICWASNADDVASVQPTHWMPLPPPPAQEDGKQ